MCICHLSFFCGFLTLYCLTFIMLCFWICVLLMHLKLSVCSFGNGFAVLSNLYVFGWELFWYFSDILLVSSFTVLTANNTIADFVDVTSFSELDSFEFFWFYCVVWIFCFSCFCSVFMGMIYLYLTLFCVLWFCTSLHYLCLKVYLCLGRIYFDVFMICFGLWFHYVFLFECFWFLCFHC